MLFITSISYYYSGFEVKALLSEHQDTGGSVLPKSEA